MQAARQTGDSLIAKCLLRESYGRWAQVTPSLSGNAPLNWAVSSVRGLAVERS